MTKVKFKWGFKYTFSTQVKMRNFSKFSKNKFYNFLNALIFLIFFFYFKANFKVTFQKHSKLLWSFESTPLITINFMHQHVCTTSF